MHSHIVEELSRMPCVALHDTKTCFSKILCNLIRNREVILSTKLTQQSYKCSIQRDTLINVIAFLMFYFSGTYEVVNATLQFCWTNDIHFISRHASTCKCELSEHFINSNWPLHQLLWNTVLQMHVFCNPTHNPVHPNTFMCKKDMLTNSLKQCIPQNKEDPFSPEIIKPESTVYISDQKPWQWGSWLCCSLS